MSHPTRRARAAAPPAVPAAKSPDPAAPRGNHHGRGPHGAIIARSRHAVRNRVGTCRDHGSGPVAPTGRDPAVPSPRHGWALPQSRAPSTSMHHSGSQDTTGRHGACPCPHTTNRLPCTVPAVFTRGRGSLLHQTARASLVRRLRPCSAQDRAHHGLRRAWRGRSCHCTARPPCSRPGAATGCCHRLLPQAAATGCPRVPRFVLACPTGSTYEHHLRMAAPAPRKPPLVRARRPGGGGWSGPGARQAPGPGETRPARRQGATSMYKENRPPAAGQEPSTPSRRGAAVPSSRHRSSREAGAPSRGRRWRHGMALEGTTNPITLSCTGEAAQPSTDGGTQRRSRAHAPCLCSTACLRLAGYTGPPGGRGTLLLPRTRTRLTASARIQAGDHLRAPRVDERGAVRVGEPAPAREHIPAPAACGQPRPRYMPAARRLENLV
jgi:hypothetical protein